MRKSTKHYRLLILISVTFLTSCQVKVKNDFESVPFTHYDLTDSIKVVGSGACFFRVQNNENIATYRIDSTHYNEISQFSVSVLFGGIKLTTKEDSLFRGAWFCPNVDKAIFKAPEGTLILTVSTFYNPTTMSNEHHLFWNPDYGLVSIYDRKSSDLLIFEHRMLKDFQFEILSYFKKKDSMH